MWNARLMCVRPYGLLQKKYYDYFRKLDEPDFYLYKLGKRDLNFWKEEFKDLDLVIETELSQVINLVNRNDNNEVIIGIRLENFKQNGEKQCLMISEANLI